MGSLIIAMTVLSLVIGFGINHSFMKEYNKPAVNIPWCILQSIFFFFAIIYMYSANNDSPETAWFYFWAIATIVSYIFGIRACIKQVKSLSNSENKVGLAVLAQIFLPIGAALFVLILAAALLGKDKKRRR